MGRVGEGVVRVCVLMMVSCLGGFCQGYVPKIIWAALAHDDDCIIFLYFNWYLEKIAIQSSSHNCPMEIKDPFFKLSNKKACCALSVNFSDKGIFASEWEVIVLPFSTVTGGLGSTCMLVQTCFAPSCR